MVRLKPTVRAALTCPFAVFTVFMLGKMYLSWFVIFESAFSWLPLLTGLPTVWTAFALIELLARKRKLMLYMIVNVVFTSVYFAAIMYYKYFGVIVTYHALQQVGQVTEVKGSVFSLLHPYFLFIYTDIVLFGLLLTFRKSFRSWAVRSLPLKRAAAGVVFPLALFVSIFCMWTNRDSINEIKQAQHMGILNYEIYAIFAKRNEPLLDESEITADAILKAKGLTPNASPNYWKIAEGKNVVVLQLEAFQNFLLGLSVDGQEITPNMNGLMKQNFYFPHIFQMVSQGNTSDAEYMLNTSFYVPPYGAASQDYGDKALPSLPKEFRNKGYEALTFHTNDVVFWNREELYKALGFTRYYDKSFYGDADTVAFGASDEVLYDKTVAEMVRLRDDGKRFYANIISMSGHHPFNLPDRKKKIELPERFDNTLVGDYLTAQQYADYAIGQLIAQLKETGLWDQTVLFIYGDHMGLPIYSLSSKEHALMKEMLGRDYSYPDMLNIPLIIAGGGVTSPQVFPQIGGHVDFMPTIANLAGISLENHLHFGQDLLNTQHNLLPERYYLPSGSLINDSSIYVPGRGYADGVTYALPTGNGAMPSEDEYKRALELLHMSDSYVSQLPKHD